MNKYYSSETHWIFSILNCIFLPLYQKLIFTYKQVNDIIFIVDKFDFHTMIPTSCAFETRVVIAKGHGQLLVAGHKHTNSHGSLKMTGDVR